MAQTAAPPEYSVTLCPLVVIFLTISCKLKSFEFLKKSVCNDGKFRLPMGIVFRIEMPWGTIGDESLDYRRPL